MTDQDIQDKIDKSTELLNEARTYFEASNYDESERCASEVLALLEKFAERDDLGEELDKTSQKYAIIGELAHAYNRLNIISLAHSDYALALSQAEIGIKFSERIGNVSRKAGLLGCIGLVHWNLSDYALALDYNGKALALAEELEDKVVAATILGNIGIVHHKLTDYQLALEYYGKALALTEELGNKAGVALWLGNIGNVHKDLSDYPLALEYYGKALALTEELGNKAGVALWLGNIGATYATPEFDGYNEGKAEEYLLMALAMNEELGTKGMNIDVLKSLSELYATSERWKEAHEHFEKYHNLEKEVQSDEAKKQAGLMEQRKQGAERDKLLSIERAEATATTKILHQVLPSSIADRLIKGEKIADYFSQISILFADIVGFTPIASKMPARKVLAFLNYVFGEFDRIIEHHGCEKIKTIGDGYMAVAGAPITCEDHAERIARAAMEMMGDIQLPDDIRSSLPKDAIFNIRIGINCGPAFGGIVGENRFVYDIYSDSVNTAARMESHGEPGKIHVSEDFAFHLQNRMDMLGDDLGGIIFEERGEIEIKGKGKMKTYFLEKNHD